MRILVLSDEVWNDKINGNNVTTNWFEGMDVEFANIYASPGAPYNQCCTDYFQITDMMMLKSIIKKKKAGRILDNAGSLEEMEAETKPQKLYGILKGISGNWLRAIRELLWTFGVYDQALMKQFIDKFQPDVIFSERRATCKMLRLEKIVHKLCDAPMFAFTGDDEYSLRQLSFSPFFWINRFMVRKLLRRNVQNYEVYYTLSSEQNEYYEKIFGCRCELLYKCGEHKTGYKKREVHDPIKLIYAGKFYCNRWKILARIADILREINENEVKMTMEIYTKDNPTKKQKLLLNDGRSSIIKGAVSQEELNKIYQDADVALHVESDDIKYRLATRFSFSTKIVDCLFSGCAVLAYCWEKHSGFTYLKRENAGICVASKEALKKVLQEICDDPEIICTYSQKAYLCAERNHLRKGRQSMLLNDFSAACRK